MKSSLQIKESFKGNQIFLKTSNSNINSNMSKNNSFLENSPGGKFKIENDTGGFTSLDKENKNSELILTTSQLTEGSMDSHESSSSTKTNKMIVNYTKSEVKEKISKIFMSFAKYYKEDKQFLLSQQSLVKILRKLNLVDEETLKLCTLDIIFRKINPHSNKLNEKQFLDYIVKLVGKMYPQEYKENAKNSVNFFIANTFEPYAKYLEESQGGNLEDLNKSNISVNIFPIKSIENLVLKTFDSQVNALLHSIYFAIKEIYLNYFHFEVNNYKDKKKIQDGSFANLLDFCKDFEVFPYLINMDQFVIYFNLILKIEIKPRDSFLTFEKDAKDIGSVFTLSRFCLMFYHFALISYLKNNTLGFVSIKSATDVDKLLLFLEKLENSNGFKNLERRTSKPHVSKLTLIPNKNVLSMIDLNIFKVDVKETNFENKTVTSFPKYDKNQIDTKTIKEFNLKNKNFGEVDLRSLLSVDREVFTYIQNKLDHLKELFQYYSVIGDKLSFNRMNISSFRKFLKDCEILLTKPRSSSLIEGKKTKTNNRNLSSQKRTEISKIKNSSISKSPDKNDDKRKSSPGKNTKNNIPRNTNRYVNFSEKGGKLTESDANILFFTLTGPRNFDNSAKIKQQFDKNTGFIGCFDENIPIGKNVYIDKTTNLKNNKDSVILKMDFFIFLKSLELIATRLYPKFNLNRAVIELFEKKINFLLGKSQKTNLKSKCVYDLLNKIDQPEIRNFLASLEPTLFTFFENYADNQFLMTFDQFFDFFKDFSLFPDIVNLIQVKNIFFTLAEIYSCQHITSRNPHDESELLSLNSDINHLNTNKQSQKVCINFPLFLESLAVTAMHFKFDDQFRDIDKLLYLLERMNQSKGFNNSIMKSGRPFNSNKDLMSFLVGIKEKYPEFYKSKLNSIVINAPATFDSLFDDE